jgi:uncharacterized membrane protein
VVSKSRLRIIVAICLCLAGGAVSGVLLGQHYGESWATATVTTTCGEAQTSGCEQVARSEWSSIAGIPLAALGLFFYSSLIILFVLALFAQSGLRDSMAGIATFLLSVSLFIDLLLLGLQAFSIHAYCKLCISTYVLSACSLIVLFPARKFARGIMAAARIPEGRISLAGWILGSVVALSSVLGFNAALHARDLYRQATMLFAPAPAEPANQTGEPSTKSASPSPKNP